MVFVVCRVSLSVLGCRLYVVCCLFDIGCQMFCVCFVLLFVVCCVLIVVCCCVLPAVCCSLRVVDWLSYVVCGLSLL